MSRPIDDLRTLFRLVPVAAIGALLVIPGLTKPAVVFAAGHARFSVNSTGDAHAAAPLTDGICATAYTNGVPNGVCTLRAAVEEANNVSGGGAVIDFAGVSGPATYVLALGQLQVTQATTIVGSGTTDTIIDGDGSATHQRVFYLSTAGVSVSMYQLTIRNGNETYTNSDPNAFAGGILSNSDLTLTNVAVKGNTALASTGAAYGGGIYMSGKLTLVNSTVTGNTANTVTGGIASGGGIIGNAMITNSTISGNTARDNGGGIYGGPTLVGSTVSGNTAANGGGVYGGNLIAVNTTIANNNAKINGGGVYQTGSVDSVFNTTISGNKANSDDVGSGDGGGVYALGTFNFANTIIAYNGLIIPTNPLPTFQPSNCAGTITSQGANIVNDTTGCTVSGTYSLTSPSLTELQNNGGPTDTESLLGGSAGIDQGQSGNCTDNLAAAITVDQRGAPRPVDGDANGTAVCDIGSVEYGGVPRYQESDLHVQYNGWRGVSDPTSSGGSYRESSVKSDKATFSFSGSSITWLTRKGPDMGKAQVAIDGVNKGTFDLYAVNTTDFAKAFTGLGTGKHKIVITVLHQSSSNGFNVVVDGFTIGTTTTQDGSCKIQYDTWKCTSTSSASGGTWRSSGTSGATAALNFSGTSISLVTKTGAPYGKASVCIDSSCQTINFVSGSATRTFSGLADAAHIIRVKPLHTKAASATGYNVVVDAFSGPIRLS